MVKIVALLCSFGLGVCFSLLGTISVKLMPRLKIDQARFGTLVTGFMSACLVASLLMGIITDRLGHKPVPPPFFHSSWRPASTNAARRFTAACSGSSSQGH